MTTKLTMKRWMPGLIGALVLVLTFSLTSLALAGSADSDEDGITDAQDNCVSVANASQRDDDLDGYGNACDTDLDQDCVTGGGDAAMVSEYWLASGPAWAANPMGNGTVGAYDVDGDGVVGGSDTAAIRGNWLKAPGASGLACAAWCDGTNQVAEPPASCP